MAKATQVVVDGPFPIQDRYGEEMPIWCTFVADDDQNPIGQVYRSVTFEGAVKTGDKIAKDRKLELTMEAMRA